MSRTPLVRRARLLAPVSLLVMVSCGGSDDTDSTPEEAPTNSTATSTPSEELVGSGADSPGAVVLGVDPTVGAALDAANGRALAALEESLSTVVLP